MLVFLSNREVQFRFLILLSIWNFNLVETKTVKKFNYFVSGQMSGQRPRMWCVACSGPSHTSDGRGRWVWNNGGMIISGGKPKEIGDNPAPVSCIPPHISHEVTQIIYCVYLLDYDLNSMQSNDYVCLIWTKIKLRGQILMQVPY
jgi:hypothetical protein